MAEGISEYVFLDTEVFIRFWFQYDSTPLKSLVELISKDRLKLVVTNIVVREVEANISKAVRSAYNAHKKFTSAEGRALVGSAVAGVADKVKWFKRDEVIADLQKQFRKFLDDNGAIVVETDAVSIDEIMDDYFGGEPPFGENPKPEFPDAITVKALAEWADDEETHVIVVSGDDGVFSACTKIDRLHPVSEIEEVLDHVASDDEKLAEFIREQVKAHEEDVRKLVIHEFENMYFYVVDENGDAEVTVTEADFDDEVEILEIGNEEATVDVNYTFTYSAEATYDDPDMVSYDSETGTSMSWGSATKTVDGREAWVRADVTVAFKGLDLTQFKVESASITEPRRSIGVRIYDPRDEK